MNIDYGLHNRIFMEWVTEVIASEAAFAFRRKMWASFGNGHTTTPTEMTLAEVTTDESVSVELVAATAWPSKYQLALARGSVWKSRTLYLTSLLDLVMQLLVNQWWVKMNTCVYLHLRCLNSLIRRFRR